MPRRDNVIEFHVRAVGAGWGSTALVWKLHPGDVIRLGAPMAAMTLDPESGRDLLCVAGGTGLAPIKALLQDLARHNILPGQNARKAHLFFGPDAGQVDEASARLA